MARGRGAFRWSGRDVGVSGEERRGSWDGGWVDADVNPGIG